MEGLILKDTKTINVSKMFVFIRKNDLYNLAVALNLPPNEFICSNGICEGTSDILDDIVI